MAFPNMDLNYIAVLISGIISMVLGSLWYSPIMFGNSWMKEARVSSKEIEKAKKAGMGKLYFATFIGALITAFVLGIFVKLSTTNDFLGGMQTGFWIWLGIAAPILLGSVLWEGKSINYYLINVFYHLINISVIAGFMTVWG